MKENRDLIASLSRGDEALKQTQVSVFQRESDSALEDYVDYERIMF